MGVLFCIGLNQCLFGQVQLEYAGTQKKIQEAVVEANKLLKNQKFYDTLAKIQTFDNTTYSGKQIIEEMNKIKSLKVIEYKDTNTKFTALTLTEIKLNTAKLNRSIPKIAATLVHETIHGVDWATNKHWDYTHKTQHRENPPISAPYIIGTIAEKMMTPPKKQQEATPKLKGEKGR